MKIDKTVVRSYIYPALITPHNGNSSNFRTVFANIIQWFGVGPSLYVVEVASCQGRSQKFAKGGDKTGGLGTEAPSGVQEQSAGGVWGLRPQKLETY